MTYQPIPSIVNNPTILSGSYGKWKGKIVWSICTCMLRRAQTSQTLALLRCILTEGSMRYDGLDTSKLNLDALRSSITIIPQMVRATVIHLRSTHFLTRLLARTPQRDRAPEPRSILRIRGFSAQRRPPFRRTVQPSTRYGFGAHNAGQPHFWRRYEPVNRPAADPRACPGHLAEEQVAHPRRGYLCDR